MTHSGSPPSRRPRQSGRPFAKTLKALAGFALGLTVSATAVAATSTGAGCAPSWPLYQSFLDRFVQPDGRVVDYSVPQLHTTSEGQSYGMLFALIAGDAATFERLWRWSVANLAGGDIKSRLPAWQWGKKPDGTWGVLDPNAASDGDLWFAYALLEAGRLWNRNDYVQDARSLMTRVVQDEVADLPGLGKMLLPGPQGFARPDKLWRLNASYMPIPLLRRLASEDKKGPWQEIAGNTARLVAQSSPKGFSADWVAYKSADGRSGTFVVDPDKGDVGSYDAIRTYMWAGMTPPADPLAAPLMRALSGMIAATSVNGLPPESVQVLSGAATGTGPVGFSAALMPYFMANGQTRLLNAQRERTQAQFNPATQAQSGPPYYDVVLGLFGTGWAEQRYRFLQTGKIQLRWESACPRANTR